MNLGSFSGRDKKFFSSRKELDQFRDLATDYREYFTLGERGGGVNQPIRDRENLLTPIIKIMNQWSKASTSSLIFMAFHKDKFTFTLY